MKQQRLWPKWVEKHKEHIYMAPVESFSCPCVVFLSNAVASKQHVQTQLWEPCDYTYILMTKLPEFTPLGKAENHDFHCCVLRPAEGPAGAALEVEGWQDLENVHLGEELCDMNSWIPLAHLPWPGKIKQPMKPSQILCKSPSQQFHRIIQS